MKYAITCALFLAVLYVVYLVCRNILVFIIAPKINEHSMTYQYSIRDLP